VPPGHVLANRGRRPPRTTAVRPGVADAETVRRPGRAGRGWPEGRAVADHVPRDDVVLGGEPGRPRSGRTITRPTGEPLADVVVGVAEQPQGDAARQERARTTGRPRPVSVMSRVSSGRPFGAPSAWSARGRAWCRRSGSRFRTGQRDPDRLATLQGIGRHLDQRVVERLPPARGPGPRCSAARSRSARSGMVSTGSRSSPGRLPVVHRLLGVEHLDVPDRLVQATEAELGQVLAGPPRRCTRRR